MMAEYHITEYGRQKILKEVVMRAQRLVVDMTWYVWVVLLARPKTNIMDLYQEQNGFYTTCDQGPH